MRIKSTIAVAAIVISGAFAAGANAETPTKVTIKPDAGGFMGKVKSADRDCRTDRNVTIYKLTDMGGEQVGSDTSAEDGRYSTGNNGQYKGRFYAYVEETANCSGAHSKRITLKR